MADIVAFSNDAIISTNLDGEVMSWNEGAEKLLGYLNEDVIGKSSQVLMSSDLEDEHRKIILDVQKGKTYNDYETIQIHKNGQEVYVSMSIFPLVGENGAVTGVSSILRDMSERVEIERIKQQFTKNLELKVLERTTRLEKAKKDLAESLAKEKHLSELKSRFVATASHQFRTPLAVIKAGIGILDLQKAGMTEKLQKSFAKVQGRIDTQVANMTDLMDEILILGNIDNGNKTATPEKFDLLKLCNSIIKLHNEIQEDGRKMKCVSNGQNFSVNLDIKLIDHALTNFISNAFKFSKGRPEPILTISEFDSEFKLSIKDFGLGIPKSELDYLFDPFYRASNVQDISGTGLGTAIAKEYIEKNQGVVDVKSIENEETEFIITFKK